MINQLVVIVTDILGTLKMPPSTSRPPVMSPDLQPLANAVLPQLDSEKPSTLLLSPLPTPRSEAISLQSPSSSASGSHGHPSPAKECHVNDALSLHPALENILRSMAPSSTKGITLDTPLASLGLDSITAIQIASKCRIAGLHVRAMDLVAASSVRDIVAKLGPGAKSPREVEKEKPTKPFRTKNQEAFMAVSHQKPISEEERADIISRFGEDGKYITKVLPMSTGAKLLLSGWQSSKGSRWQTLWPFRLPVDVDAARLKNAWVLLLKRHDVLRATAATASNSGEPRYVVFNTDFPYDHWFEETYPYPTFHQNLVNRLQHFVRHPLDLKRCAIRTTLFRSQPAGHAYIVIHINHIHYDGGCMPHLLKDFNALYNVLDPIPIIPIEPFLNSFPIQGAALDTQEQFWKATLPVPFKPVSFPRLHTPNDIELPRYVKRICLQQSSEVLKMTECQKRVKLEGTTLGAICLATWAVVHARYAGNTHATFGIWHSGRSGLVDGIELAIVPACNVLPIHVDTTAPVWEIARYIRKNLVDRTPEVEQSELADIARWTQAGDAPIINTNVNILHTAAPSPENMFIEPVRIVRTLSFGCP